MRGIEALADLPPHLRMRLIDALEAGLLVMPSAEVAQDRSQPAADKETANVSLTQKTGASQVQADHSAQPSPPKCNSLLGSIRSLVDAGDHTESISEGLGALAGLGISGPAAAAWLRSLNRIASRTRKPDLVWSGPAVPGVPARDTRQVYEELLGSARQSIWASTYAFFDGPRAFQVLARRMDQVPEIHVTLLVNIQRRKGDTTAPNELVREFADHFWHVDWPGHVRPRVFYDPRALGPEGPGGVLHAKAVVADSEAVFITSANLTEAALDRNIELGLLVRDRAIAASVISQFQGLIDQGCLSLLP